MEATVRVSDKAYLYYKKQGVSCRVSQETAQIMVDKKLRRKYELLAPPKEYLAAFQKFAETGAL